MIAEPPSFGADQTSVTLPLPAVAERSAGAPGVVAGVADIALEAGPVPTALVAVTVKVCATPLVRPATVQPSAPAVVHVAPPGLAVAV